MNAKLILLIIGACVLSAAVIVHGGVVQNNEVIDYGNEDYFGVQVYKTERPCALLGGICVHKTDCVEGHITSTSGLCPASKHLGVECCYQVSIRPTTCRQLLGECMPYCNGNLKRADATDCSASTECCILV